MDQVVFENVLYLKGVFTFGSRAIYVVHHFYFEFKQIKNMYV